MGIRNTLKKMYNNIVNQLKVIMVKGIKTNLNNHKSYEHYLTYQQVKTKDPQRIKKWLDDEWKMKYDGFMNIFNRNYKYLQNKNNALCLGARTGQEVKALIDLGIKAIGIDLVEFLPYTIKGDIHNLKYKESEFDLVFTNIMDHALYPDKFCKEIQRICKNDGIIIIHLKLGDDLDEFSETSIYDPQSIIQYFNEVKILSSKKIDNLHDSMNWEIIFIKNEKYK